MSAHYLKREDLNHTGARRLDHCMAEALLAGHMDKRRLIRLPGRGDRDIDVVADD